MKKETGEEAAERFLDMCNGIVVSKSSFIAGAKWQADRMYSEKEVFGIIDKAFHMYASSHRHDAREWFETVKNK